MSVPFRIGVRAHDFGRLPADELAAKIAAKGLTCAQLAVNKAIAGVDLKPGDLTPGLAWHIGQAFQKAGVQIAVLGCYINLSHPDPGARRPLLGYFKDHLRCARDFGCAVVGTETGSLNADWSFHPDNVTEHAFRALVPVVAELVAEAEQFGVTVGIEGVTSHVLNSPRRVRRLIDEIRSPNLQVIFDPVNLLSAENYREQDRVVKESFELFGERIAVIHAKDFAAEGAGPLKQVRTGAGGGGATAGSGLNYRLLMEFLAARKPGISILLEESTEATAAECAAYIRANSR
jgi:sugar phosphate isomerase/epimerase